MEDEVNVRIAEEIMGYVWRKLHWFDPAERTEICYHFNPVGDMNEAMKAWHVSGFTQILMVAQSDGERYYCSVDGHATHVIKHGCARALCEAMLAAKEHEDPICKK